MSNVTVQNITMNNVVSGEKLREVQAKVLEELSYFLSSTYGPMASNTEIITGNDAKSIKVEYSKDGLKVLKNIIYSQPIEMAIQSEIEEIARYVEHKVGDGTTSSVILSNEIFKGLIKIKNQLPSKIIKVFQEVVELIQEEILSNKRDISMEDIKNIAMISTNGNKEISNIIYQLYDKYGMDVNIEVGVSNDTDNKVKEYDGLCINQGYSDRAYINNLIDGSCTINNPHIYAFADPIDTPEMVNFLEAIIKHNIIDPINQYSYEVDEDNFIPTVIFAPKITRDASNLITNLVQMLLAYDAKNMQSQKPPILIITNIFGVDEDIYFDIMNLCRAKLIRKFIDPKIQKSEQEKGNAPTIENIHEWFGYAEQISSDADNTKIINPKCFIEEGNKDYEIQIQFLESELNRAISNNQDSATIGTYKKRLRALKANMIEFLVGGISISDRDQLRDLVEDAVKNCSSAAEYGVGYAANFEGLRASNTIFSSFEKKEENDIYRQISAIIANAYGTVTEILYNSVVNDKYKATRLMKNSYLEDIHPYNVRSIFECEDYKNDKSVLCSIRTDIEILNAISKLITLMVTANQCLIQAPILNKY